MHQSLILCTTQEGKCPRWGTCYLAHKGSVQRNKLYIQKETPKKPEHSTLAPDGGGENLLKFLTTSQYSVVVSGLYDIILYDYMI